jgi:hypothetical protein
MHFHKSDTTKPICIAPLIVFCILACTPRTGRFGLPRYDYVYQVPEEIDDGWQTSSLSQANVGDENHFFKMNMLKENDQWYILKQSCF